MQVVLQHIMHANCSHSYMSAQRPEHIQAAENLCQLLLSCAGAETEGGDMS